MKRIIIIAIIALAAISCNTNAQTGITREGKTFMYQQKAMTAGDIPTDYLWRDKDSTDHTIYLHQYKSGDKAGQWTCYILKQSKTTGKDYRHYLKEGPQIAEQILKEIKPND